MAEISSEIKIRRDKRKRSQTSSSDSFGSKSKRSYKSLPEDDKRPIGLHQTQSKSEKQPVAKGRKVEIPGCIVYKCDEMSETLDEWLKKNAPSQIKCSSAVPWIVIKRRLDSYTQTGDVISLKQAWRSLESSGQPINQKVIMELARRYNVLEGKWLFFAQTGIMVDQMWSSVCKGIMTQKLPCNIAKVNPVNVSTEKGGLKSHTICVYNHDFTKVDEVYKLEAGLRDIGIECRLVYKPDVYTYLNVYSNNKWGLRPTLYQSKYDKTMRKSVVHPCN